jgi:hypothetical protein
VGLWQREQAGPGQMSCLDSLGWVGAESAASNFRQRSQHGAVGGFSFRGMCDDGVWVEQRGGRHGAGTVTRQKAAGTLTMNAESQCARRTGGGRREGAEESAAGQRTRTIQGGD